MRISDWSSDVCSSDLHATLRINGKSSGRHAHCHAFDLDRVKWSFLQRAQIRVGQTRVASHDPAPRHGTTRKIFINASFTETIEARHGAFEALSINSEIGRAHV